MKVGFELQQRLLFQPDGFSYKEKLLADGKSQGHGIPESCRASKTILRNLEKNMSE